MLNEDELKESIQDGVKSADRCSRFCTYGGKVEEVGMTIFHNGISSGDTDVQVVHDTKVLGMNKEQLAERVKTWVAGLHTGVKLDLNAGLVEERGPSMTGWPWGGA